MSAFKDLQWLELSHNGETFAIEQKSKEGKIKVFSTVCVGEIDTSGSWIVNLDRAKDLVESMANQTFNTNLECFEHNGKNFAYQRVGTGHLAEVFEVNRVARIIATHSPVSDTARARHALRDYKPEQTATSEPRPFFVAPTSGPCAHEYQRVISTSPIEAARDFSRYYDTAADRVEVFDTGTRETSVFTIEIVVKEAENG